MHRKRKGTKKNGGESTNCCRDALSPLSSMATCSQCTCVSRRKERNLLPSCVAIYFYIAPNSFVWITRLCDQTRVTFPIKLYPNFWHKGRERIISLFQATRFIGLYDATWILRHTSFSTDLTNVLGTIFPTSQTHKSNHEKNISSVKKHVR